MAKKGDTSFMMPGEKKVTKVTPGQFASDRAIVKNMQDNEKRRANMAPVPTPPQEPMMKNKPSVQPKPGQIKPLDERIVFGMKSRKKMMGGL